MEDYELELLRAAQEVLEQNLGTFSRVHPLSSLVGVSHHTLRVLNDVLNETHGG